MLRQPIAGVAPPVGRFCEIERCLNGFVRRFADAYWGLIKDGEFQICILIYVLIQDFELAGIIVRVEYTAGAISVVAQMA